VVCLLFLLASCVAQPLERAAEADEVQELPASRFPAPAAAADAYETAAELTRAIQLKVRGHLVLPPGRFPASTKVTVKVMVSSEGGIQRLVVSQSSRFRSVDRAVLRAVLKSEPLPVLTNYKETKRPLELQLVFLPFAR
jgi:TonB family protein